MLSKLFQMIQGIPSRSTPDEAVYRYTIRDAQGHPREGELRAASLTEAVRLLEKRSQAIINIEKVSLAPQKPPGRIGQQELMLFFSQLSVMLANGIPLHWALTILSEQQKDSGVCAMVAELRNALGKGCSFSDSLKLFPDLFSRFHVSLVRAGEAGGFLDRSLDYLSSVLEKEHDLRRKVSTALNYPCFVLLLGISITLAAFYFIYPYLRILVSEMEVKLPFYSKALMACADQAGNLFFSIPLLLVIVYLASRLKTYLEKTIHGRMLKEKLVLSIPVARDIVKKAIIIRIFIVMDSLLSSGVHIVQAIELAADTCENFLVERALTTVAEKVRMGEKFSHALAAFPDLFSRLAVNMVTVGEESGELSEMCAKTSSLYTLELQGIIECFTRIIEPVAICTTGLVIGGIVVSFFMPVYMTLSQI